MDKKVTGIVCYLTWIGWVIAYIAGDREGAKFHLNQSLVLAVAGILGVVIGIFTIIGLVYACMGEEKELPIIGGIKILNQYFVFGTDANVVTCSLLSEQVE